MTFIEKCVTKWPLDWNVHSPVVAVEMERRVTMNMVLVFKDVMKVYMAICVGSVCKFFIFFRPKVEIRLSYVYL